jgi:plastocyanin
MRKALFTIEAVFFLLASSHAGEAGQISGKVRGESAEKHQVVVFVQDVGGKKVVRPAVRSVIDQKDKSFIPRILPVLVGTSVEFKNNDPFKHNIFSPDGERYNLGTWVGEKGKSYTFKKAGVYRQLCNIHPEMLGYIVVLETPYFALTDKDGRFEIAGVPSGKYILKVWGEKLTKEQLSRTFNVLVEEGAPAFVDVDLLR